MFYAERFEDEEPANTQAFVISTLQGLYNQLRNTEMAVGYDRCGEAVGILAGVVQPDVEVTDEDPWPLVITKRGPLDEAGHYEAVIGFYNPLTARPEKASNYYDTEKVDKRIGANPCDDMRLATLLGETTFDRIAAEQELAGRDCTLSAPLLLDGPGGSQQYRQTLDEIRGDFS